jgi:hypothetical protein
MTQIRHRVELIRAASATVDVKKGNYTDATQQGQPRMPFLHPHLYTLAENRETGNLKRLENIGLLENVCRLARNALSEGSVRRARALSRRKKTDEIGKLLLPGTPGRLQSPFACGKRELSGVD